MSRKINCTLIIEGMSHNLLSVSELLSNVCNVCFNKNTSGVKQAKFETGNNVFYCKLFSDIFIFKIDIESKVSSSILSNVECHNTFTSDNDIWHKRLGHVNRHSIKLLNLPLSSTPSKECIEGETGRLKFGKVVKKLDKLEN